jgi:hypothetical protein
LKEAIITYWRFYFRIVQKKLKKTFKETLIRKTSVHGQIQTGHSRLQVQSNYHYTNPFDHKADLINMNN